MHPDAGSSKQTQHRVVVDTSVLISALFFGGTAQLVLTHIAERQQLLVSDEIIEELIAFAKHTSPKTPIRTLRLMRQTLERYSQEYDSTAPIAIRDINDVHVVQLAHAHQAVILTGDRDLLEHKGSATTAMLTVNDYAELFL